MRVRGVLLAGFACALLAAPTAQAADFAAGAATTDVTPPLKAGNPDPAAFASCPAAVFSGHRTFTFEEPYVDSSANQHWDLGEPYCDANANGRYDEVLTSGATIGNPRVATAVHDKLDARALAVSDGSHTAVIVSVTAQGLFNTYIDRMIARAKTLAHIDYMIVSANHNESSPDTIGIYGGPSPSTPPVPPFPSLGSPAGLQSGINDYYMSFLVDQVARAAAEAANSQRAATLRAAQFPIPPNLAVRLSDNWPTTDNDIAKPRAINPKVGLLQALGANGAPIFTVMSLAAHNQQIGHSGTSELSGDWPGFFHAALESRVGGTAIFLVGDNGSEEDPCIQPPICASKLPDPYEQARATGEALAQAVAGQVPLTQSLRRGALRYARSDFCVPIENNLFKAAAVAGLFGQRVTYTNVNGTCVPAGASAGGSAGAGPTASGAPDSLITGASLLDVGPDLQLIANPGEAFPALMLGSPWRHADVPSECQGRSNPAVPTWPAHGLFRLQVGLANDMIGYEIPAWAYIDAAGNSVVTQQGSPNDPNCNSGSGSKDSAGHQHKLESEGVGPTASNAVANQLAGLVNADAPDPSARIRRGRYVLADGSYSHFPARSVGAKSDAVGVLLADGGAAGLNPAAGTLIGAPTTAGFGARAVDASGVFMDYDGQPQARPDVTTRGMMVLDARGCVSARYYLDEFPDLDTSRALGAAASQSSVLPAEACSAQSSGVPGLQTGAALAAGLPVPAGTFGARSHCINRTRPDSIAGRRSVTLRAGRRLRINGRATAYGCGGQRGRIARVTITISRVSKGRCRFVKPDGRLTGRRSCGKPIRLLARGTGSWSLSLRLRLPRGGYNVEVLAVDRNGLSERTHGRRLNVLRLRVR